MPFSMTKKRNPNSMTTPCHITFLPKLNLIGKSIVTNRTKNNTYELWKAFKQELSRIAISNPEYYYAVEQYSNTYFDSYHPEKPYNQWACITVPDGITLPTNWNNLIVSEGLYAIFKYKGTAADAHHTIRSIHEAWLPISGYVLANRPHYALMHSDYDPLNPTAEEHFYIPIH